MGEFFGLLIFFAAVAAAGTWTMIRVRILDVPNRRSSHARPVPRCGGAAIVVAFFLGLATVRQGGWGLVVGAALVALVGLADDLGRLGVAGKLAGQLAAAVVLVVSGVVLDAGIWGYALTLFWVVAMTNLVNFMDGLDGLVGGTGVIAAFSFALIADSKIAAILAFACLGFLVFNMPRARIFMGDVGSEFLGFVLAALAVAAAGKLSFLVMPLLMFHFLFDTAFTLCRRLAEGRNVTQAHRGHLYQLMNRLGLSHFQVSLFHWAVGIAQAFGASWMLTLPEPWVAFLPFLAFEAVYAATVMILAHRRGIEPG
jgi:UDP-GlcNAc:undecaprenyl-phosphate GlcNAc-1-phosphate transferase